jgi:hypothetical protein
MPAAHACAAYGLWLTRREHAEEAQPLLQEARTTYASLGAVARLEELEKGLAAQSVGS